MRIRYAILGVILIALAWSLPFVFQRAVDSTPHVRIGQPAPPFHAITLDLRDSLTLADYRGRVVLLNLWATWCAPCREEMPSMQRLRGLVDDARFAIVAVAVDGWEPPGRIREFADALDLTFDVLYDPTELTAIQYQVYSLPQSVLIDADGIVRHREFGAVRWDDSASVQRVLDLLPPTGER